MEFNNEHGRISIYILVVIFFVMIVIMGKYLITSNELEKERRLLEEAKKGQNVEVENSVSEPASENDENDVDVPKYVVKDDDIPVYNSDAFLFFSKYIEEKDSPEYYIYQEDCAYIGGKNKDYILMSDIFIDEDKDVFERKNMLIEKIDFNNHRINLRDGEYISE